MDTSKWIKFFIDAGILSSFATEYAILFNEHRIRQDMLLDLSKEYLNDMGIKTLGDVIAILKHAKITHGKIAKDKVIEELGPSTKPITATRMLGQYAKNLPSSTSPVSKTPSFLANLKQANSKKLISLKKKIEIKTASLNEAKKKRRVLPHEEGRYMVIMPQGTTPKTKKILEQQRKITVIAPNKKSVFNRLGESVVSSTSDLHVAASTSSDSVFNRLDLKSSSLSLSYQGDLRTNIDSTKDNRLLRKAPAAATNVRSRLGPHKNSYEISSTTLSNNNYSNLQITKPSNVIRTNSLATQRRNLGTANPYARPQTKSSVFDRLGE